MKGKDVELTFEEGFMTYVKSAFPLLVVSTPEIDRAIDKIAALTFKWNKMLPKMNLPEDKEFLKINGYNLMVWDVLNGWRSYDRKRKIESTGKDPQTGLTWLTTSSEATPGVYIMVNVHMHFQDTYSLPEIVALLREQVSTGKTDRKHLFLVGDVGELPSEIRQMVVSLDFPLPSRDTLEDFICEYTDELGMNITENEIQDAADAASGMTTHEVESAVCVAAVKSKGKSIEREIIFAEKAKAVKTSGLLEHIPTTFNIDKHIGGLEHFKEWLRKVGTAFRERSAAEEYGLPTPKGCLVAGISGTGKSASAQATANLFGVSLYRLDIGRVFGGIVGETERRTRQLIQLMEALAPCVILIDEIEKALAGLGSSDAADAGVTARLFSNLLYWLQEKKSAVYMIATANQIDKLPPEMLRKGRFDELWFVDLPSAVEREAILRIHLQRVGRDPKKFTNLKKLAVEHMKGFTGAEIEAIVKQAMFNAFSQVRRGKHREFTTKDLEEATASTVPLIKTKPKEIAALRQWAQHKARIANVGEIVRVDDIKVSRKTTAPVFFDDEKVGRRKRRSDA